MRVDLVARPSRHLPGDGSHPAVTDLDRPPAARADDVVVMGRLAGDVRVLPAGKVQPLQQAELLEQLERPENGCAADAQPPVPGVIHQVCGGEVAVTLRDELGDGAPGLG